MQYTVKYGIILCWIIVFLLTMAMYAFITFCLSSCIFIDGFEHYTNIFILQVFSIIQTISWILLFIAGAIASPPAVMNAVIDAIGTEVSMPATSEKVWKALKDKSDSKKKAA